MEEFAHLGLRGFRFPKLGAADRLRHVFAARADDDRGNLSLSGGRDQDAARGVRAAWSSYLEVAPQDWVVGSQVHGATVRRVNQAERGRGALDPMDVLPPCDGLWTTEPGLPLYVAAADCGAVLLHRAARADCEAALAVVHAGWRGLHAGVVRAAVEALGGPEGLRAGVAPCAGWDSYETGEEVAAHAPAEAVRRDSPKAHVDIARWACAELRTAGLAEDAVEVAGIDSIADPRCFSHRRQGETAGRMGLIALLAPDR